MTRRFCLCLLFLPVLLGLPGCQSGRQAEIEEVEEDPRSMDFPETLGYAIGSQAAAVINQPVSSLVRVVTYGATTAADLVDPDTIRKSGPIPPVVPREGMDLKVWEGELDRLTRSPATLGRMEYYLDGETFYRRLETGIDDAGSSILIRIYSFAEDDVAVDIADRLKRRSREIEVKVMLDGLGTYGTPKPDPETIDYEPPESIIRYLRTDSEINVRVQANPLLTGDHTKSITLDEKVAFIGGMNIGALYRNDWHDLMTELDGPVVSEVVKEFRKTWVASGLLGDLRRLFYRPKALQQNVSPDMYPVRLLYTRPGSYEIRNTQLEAIKRARHRIYIQNPYLTSDEFVKALVEARRRGVDVRVIMPYKNDFKIIRYSNIVTANTLIEHGVRVYIYPGMSHVKAAVYDGWACIGSANLDNFSLRVNKEMNVATSHAPAVDTLVERCFETDLKQSVELTEQVPTNWRHYLSEIVSDFL